MYGVYLRVKSLGFRLERHYYRDDSWRSRCFLVFETRKWGCPHRKKAGGPNQEAAVAYLHARVPIACGPFRSSLWLYHVACPIWRRNSPRQIRAMRKIQNTGKPVKINTFYWIHTYALHELTMNSLSIIAEHWICIHSLQTSYYVLLLAYHMVLRELFKEKIVYPTCTRKKEPHF